MYNAHFVLKIGALLGLTLTFSLVPSHAFSKPPAQKGRCVLYNSLKAYDCVGLDLSTIPADLSTSTEVLDVSYNRIRELTNNSLKNYVYLKKLYLNDNMIITIEVGTFDGLTNLDTLDLTMNALIEVPASIFHMASLEKLMIGKNLRLDILTLFNNAAPVTAPLQYLDISHSPLLTQLPNFGIMMDLLHLNITGNHVTNVSKAHFVGLCNLRWFTDNSTMEFSTACECAQIQRWFEVKKVTTIPPFSNHCEFAKDKCAKDLEPNAYELAIDEKCKADYQVRETLKSVSQICLIAFGVIGGIILVVGLCYLYYRWQRFGDDENKNVKNDLKSSIKAKEHLMNNSNS